MLSNAGDITIIHHSPVFLKAILYNKIFKQKPFQTAPWKISFDSLVIAKFKHLIGIGWNLLEMEFIGECQEWNLLETYFET